jgi:hypothetical protein
MYCLSPLIPGKMKDITVVLISIVYEIKIEAIAHEKMFALPANLTYMMGRFIFEDSLL